MPQCPECKNTNIAEILYGNIAITKHLQEQLDSGKAILGGCNINEHSPQWECNKCNHTWGKVDFDKDED